MVKPVATISVVPKLPESLKRLEQLAYNLWWSWNHDAIALFRRVDRDLWISTGHNPVINAYRRITPDQRTEDEHPFVMSDFDVARRYFGRVDTSFFHFTSLAALGLLKTKAFHPVADRLERLDQRLFRRFPSLQRFGWMVVIDASEPRPV